MWEARVWEEVGGDAVKARTQVGLLYPCLSGCCALGGMDLLWTLRSVNTSPALWFSSGLWPKEVRLRELLPPPEPLHTQEGTPSEEQLLLIVQSLAPWDCFTSLSPAPSVGVTVPVFQGQAEAAAWTWLPAQGYTGARNESQVQNLDSRDPRHALVPWGRAPVAGAPFPGKAHPWPGLWESTLILRLSGVGKAVGEQCFRTDHMKTG